MKHTNPQTTLQIVKRNHMAIMIALSILIIVLLNLCVVFLFSKFSTPSTLPPPPAPPFSSPAKDIEIFSKTNHSISEIEHENYRRFRFLDDRCRLTKINNHNNAFEANAPKSARFTKLIFIIIDALRTDFVPTVLIGAKQNRKTILSRKRFPFLESRIVANDAIALQSIASVPTVTLPRLKAILSGTLSTFLDYIRNLNAYKFCTDNFVRQFHKRGSKIVFYGDDTWGRLFPAESRVFIRSNLTKSFDVTDYIGVDINVTENVRLELRQPARWDVMIAHYLGLDHIGHSHGYHSPLIPGKLLEMDSIIREIHGTLAREGERALIVITGDHGMTDAGNHGGDQREETHTPLIFISTDQQSGKNSSNFRCDSKSSSIFSPLSARTFPQIDIAATISALFDLRIPIESEGRLISTVLDHFAINPAAHLCALFRNAYQLQHVMRRKAVNGEVDWRKNAHWYTQTKSILDCAMTHHEQLITEDRNFADPQLSASERFLFTRSRDAYQRYLGRLQRRYVRANAAASESASLQIVAYQLVAIALLAAIIVALIRIEYRNPQSIVLRRSSSSSSRSSWPNSFITRSLIGTIFVANALALLSLPAVQAEGTLWNAVIAAILIGIFCANFAKIRKFKIRFAIWLTGASAALYFAAIRWRIIVHTTPWGEIEPESEITTTATTDIYHLLTQSKLLLSITFAISQIIIIRLASSGESDADNIYRSVLHYSAHLFIYLYRVQTGALHDPAPALQWRDPANVNIYAQIVYMLAFVQLFDQSILMPIVDRVCEFRFSNAKNRIQKSAKNQQIRLASASSPIAAVRQTWTTLATLLLDPRLQPLLAIHMSLEYILNRALSSTKTSAENGKKRAKAEIKSNYYYDNAFVRLGLYVAFGQASFYQAANTNTLSTVNVSACFVGIDEYRLAPCATLMIISTYATYGWWILSFFDRTLRSSSSSSSSSSPSSSSSTLFDHSISNESKNFDQFRFNSIICCFITIRLVVQWSNICVTFALRDHPFIWSVILPKLLYELMFTAICFAAAALAVACAYISTLVNNNNRNNKNNFVY